jgi:tRNA G18 (ribose-2'-O)-methylase SpoU
MTALTGFNFHRGVLAIVRRPPMRDVSSIVAAALARPIVGPAPVLVVAEHLVDVDNVGSCFRNARAFGAAGMLLDERCPDPLYRKAVRTSLGAVLEMPWTQAPIVSLMNVLTESSVATVGLVPHHGGATIAEVAAELPAQAPVALVVGNEGHGLAAETQARCARLACIPMAAGADSLNVATALAVALYEWRVRRP